MEKDIQDLHHRIMEEARRGVYDSLPEFWTQWSRINPGEIPGCLAEFLYVQVPEEYLPKLQVLRIKAEGSLIYDYHHEISTEDISILSAARLLSRHYASLPERLRELTYDFDGMALRAKDFSNYDRGSTVMHYWEVSPEGVPFFAASTRELRRRDIDAHMMLEISPLSFQSALNLIALSKKIRVVFFT